MESFVFLPYTSLLPTFFLLYAISQFHDQGKGSDLMENLSPGFFFPEIFHPLVFLPNVNPLGLVLLKLLRYMNIVNTIEESFIAKEFLQSRICSLVRNNLIRMRAEGLYRKKGAAPKAWSGGKNLCQEDRLRIFHFQFKVLY